MKLARIEKELNARTATLAKMREKVKEHAEDAVEKAATIGGGAVAGYIDARYPDKNVMGLPAPVVAGTALVAVEMLGWAGKASGTLGGIGIGMLAYEAGKAAAEAASK